MSDALQTPELEAALQLRSGEDAIAFFARYANSTPLKFVYCNRADQVRATAHLAPARSPAETWQCVTRAVARACRCPCMRMPISAHARLAPLRPSVACLCLCRQQSPTGRTTWCDAALCCLPACLRACLPGCLPLCLPAACLPAACLSDCQTACVPVCLPDPWRDAPPPLTRCVRARRR